MKTTVASEDLTEYLTTDPLTIDNNFTVLFDSIAHEVTNMLQSSANPNATNITGIAYVTELYVHVRWLWLIFPFLTVLTSITILNLTFLYGRKRPHLFRTRISAAIAVEPGAWDRGRVCRRVADHEQATGETEEDGD